MTEIEIKAEVPIPEGTMKVVDKIVQQTLNQYDKILLEKLRKERNKKVRQNSLFVFVYAGLILPSVISNPIDCTITGVILTVFLFWRSFF